MDDEELIADTLAEILNRSGYDAIARYSGDSAIECIEEQCPEIVVLDVVLPDCNGLHLAQSVRLRFPAARILLFSGNAVVTEVTDAATGEKSSFEILAKPIHPVAFLKALRS